MFASQDDDIRFSKMKSNRTMTVYLIDLQQVTLDPCDILYNMHHEYMIKHWTLNTNSKEYEKRVYLI